MINLMILRVRKYLEVKKKVRKAKSKIRRKLRKVVRRKLRK